MNSMQIAKLALEDGTVMTGESFGAAGEVAGEVCFNTSMSGYQEILTDPSYRGQIVVMTCPQIGNYGVNAEDVESVRPHLSGFVVRELSRRVSNYRADGDLHSYLLRHGIVALQGLDTRALVRRIRIHGALRGVLSTHDLNDESLVAKARAAPGLVGRDLAREVAPKQPLRWQQPLHPWATLAGNAAADLPPDAPHVIALDYGMKWNIARHLYSAGCRVTVLPGTATAEEVLAHNPDGVLLSNGPGDPARLGAIAREVAALWEAMPVLGICLGHQILALAAGARTFKLPFGHRGSNHPVRDGETGQVAITTQNHGYAVDEATLAGTGLLVTHRNLHDGTVEGMRHRRLPVFSVQYHPEGRPGPQDSVALFDRFLAMVAAHGTPGRRRAIHRVQPRGTDG